jgi:hypothetical protein
LARLRFIALNSSIMLEELAYFNEMKTKYAAVSQARDGSYKPV